MLRYNQTGMIQAFRGGNARDVMIDSFYKSYFDLKNTDERLGVMVKESLALTAEATALPRLAETIVGVVPWFLSSSVKEDNERAKNIEQAKGWEQQYSKNGQMYAGAAPKNSDVLIVEPKGDNGTSSETVDTLLQALHLLFFNAAAFIAEARLDSMNPVTPIPIYETILRLRDTMNTFGLWYLPALYGMLGSAVFHMRRFLDPNIPNPSSIRTTYRIFLGAFAGIVVVWFWAPSPHKGSQQEFSALSSFSVAFLVGFSIDIFFQALDRLVTKVSQTIG
jgi:hypothetical protein